MSDAVDTPRAATIDATVTVTTPPAPPAPPKADPAPGETSPKGLVVSVVTPFFAAAAAWIAGWVANHVPGVHLDPTQLTALMVTIATTVLGMALKWLHGWQAHERRVAAGEVQPAKAARAAIRASSPAPGRS